MPITDYAFEELNEGSGVGTLGADGQPSEFQRVFKIAWQDLGGFLLALKGGWKQINANTLQHFVPDQHPDWPGVFCASAAYEGFGVSSQDPATKRSSWEYARVTAVYRTATLDHGGSDLSKIYEEDFDFSLEIVTLPVGSLVTAANKEIDFPATLRIPTLTYTITMPALPKLPGGNIKTIMALLGRMNDAGFGGADAGHMLFMGMRASRKGTSPLLGPLPPVVGGNLLDTPPPAWFVQLKLEYRDEHTWDELYVPGVGWTKVKYKADGKPLFASGNMNVLLPNGS
jgi:hypothetical protein